MHKSIHSGEENLCSTIDVFDVDYVLDLQCEVVFCGLVVEIEELDKLFENDSKVQGQR